MNRDKCIQAISDAFEGVIAESSTLSLHVVLDTNPKREVVFEEQFVRENIDGEGMTQEMLTEFIKAQPNNKWFTHSDGSMTLVVR